MNEVDSRRIETFGGAECGAGFAGDECPFLREMFPAPGSGSVSEFGGVRQGEILRRMWVGYHRPPGRRQVTKRVYDKNASSYYNKCMIPLLESKEKWPTCENFFGSAGGRVFGGASGSAGFFAPRWLGGWDYDHATRDRLADEASVLFVPVGSRLLHARERSAGIECAR